MPFEISAHIGLVGKFKSVGYFLYAECGGLQQHFYFQNDEVVYHLFGGLAGDAPANPGQVFGGDAEAVGIKVHFPFGDAVFMDQRHEVFKQFVLPVLALDLPAGETTLALIINIHQEALQVVFHNLQPETVLPVFVNRQAGIHQPVNDFSVFVRQLAAGILFDETKERRVKPHAGLTKHIHRTLQVGDEKVRAGAFHMQHSAGEENDLRAFGYFMLFQVDSKSCLPLPAKINGYSRRLVQAVHAWGQASCAYRKCLFLHRVVLLSATKLGFIDESDNCLFRK